MFHASAWTPGRKGETPTLAVKSNLTQLRAERAAVRTQVIISLVCNRLSSVVADGQLALSKITSASSRLKVHRPDALTAGRRSGFKGQPKMKIPI